MASITAAIGSETMTRQLQMHLATCGLSLGLSGVGCSVVGAFGESKATHTLSRLFCWLSGIALGVALRSIPLLSHTRPTEAK